MNNRVEIELSPEQALLHEAFFPYARGRFSKAKDESVRFVHYTSAENAFRIFDENEVTLRSASLMNDFSEGHYGYRLVHQAMNGGATGEAMRHSLEGIHLGLFGMVRTYFEQFSRTRPYDTFLLSVSEHGSDDQDEDRYGRLSMWRAYGGDTNVALVLNAGPFLRVTEAVKVFTSPVLYADHEIFLQFFHEWITAISERMEKLRELPIEKVAAAAAYSLFVATLSTKHPGFKEEREWRLIYTPGIQSSDRVDQGLKTIAGVPQKIFKLPLVDFPDECYWGTTIPELLERLIVGPTAYPAVLHSAFAKKLQMLDVGNAEEKVRVSDIPIRR